MTAVVSLFVVLILSLLVVRVASVALALTGLSHESARFQARSAFSGAGFTTSESEKVVKHPVRRRIILVLMLLGNAGIITAVSTLMLSFVSVKESTGVIGSLWYRLLLIVLGLCVLWTAANSQWLDRQMRRVILWALKRWTRLDVRDYAGLLHLTGDYVVVELTVGRNDWLASRKLEDLQLAEEGVLVLGVEKPDDTYLGAPRGDTRLEPDDTLVLYGRVETLEDLDERRGGHEGNWAHFKAKEKQLEASAEEQKQAERGKLEKAATADAAS